MGSPYGSPVGPPPKGSPFHVNRSRAPSDPPKLIFNVGHLYGSQAPPKGEEEEEARAAVDGGGGVQEAAIAAEQAMISMNQATAKSEEEETVFAVSEEAPVVA